MSKVIVTGAAGFIGSHLSQALLELGHHVVGVDSITDYYDQEQKRRRIGMLSSKPNFTSVLASITEVDLGSVLTGVDVVYHLAAQPGVRGSWGSNFSVYIENNVSATQRLLEESLAQGVNKVVYASSSSVYGDAVRYPTDEMDPTVPRSPYGVTKLAAENLCRLYAANYGLRTASLRYHTVFGPRQRPDMAIHRLISAAMSGEEFPLFGAMDAIRDFTFVEDIVRGTIAAGTNDELMPGVVMNLSGGESVSMSRLVSTVEEVVGKPVRLQELGPTAGDVSRTGGSSSAALRLLGWVPRWSLVDGVAAQYEELKMRPG